MASRDSAPPLATHTTNEEDQREAEKLQVRLRSRQGPASSERKHVPSVKIADGAHKYVQLRASLDGKTQFFVTSKRGASYHRNVAEPLIFELEQAGYDDIEVTGGGRIFLDENANKISIFGFSYSFGQANHAVSRQVILKDPRYKEFDVKVSNEGY